MLQMLMTEGYNVGINQSFSEIQGFLLRLQHTRVQKTEVFKVKFIEKGAHPVA